MIGCLRECKLIVISLVFHNFNKHKANIRTLNRTKQSCLITVLKVEKLLKLTLTSVHLESAEVWPTVSTGYTTYLLFSQ